MNWIKEKWRKFKWWILGLLFPVVLAATLSLDNPNVVKIGDILGKKEILLPDFDVKGRPIRGTEKLIVKYAYVARRMDESISPKAIQEAQKNNLIVTSEILEKRGKNSRTFKTDKDEVLVGEFISGVPQYYKDDEGLWWQADYATATPADFSNLPKSPLFKRLFPTGYFNIKRAFAVTGTFYPDPDPETATVDGLVYRSGVNETFGTIRAEAGTGSGDAASTQGLQIETSGTNNQFITIARHIYLFDTSSIGSGSTITSATFSIIPNSFFGNTNNKMNVSSSTPASNTALVNADYGQTGITKYSTAVLWSSMTAGSYTDFTLNADGRNNISLTGVSKFSGKQEDDIDGAFSPAWTGNQEWGAVIRMAEYADTTSDPKLVVVYSTAAAVSWDGGAQIIFHQ